MCRQSTVEKEKIVLKEFQRLLRSGKDLSANSMYEDAGKKVFLEGPTAGNIIRKHYRKQIQSNVDMITFVQEHESLRFNDLMKEFAITFKVCERESRLIIGYIR
jgi:hypothetical protein